MPILLVESGPDRGKSIHVSEGEVFIVGRAPASHLTLSDDLTAPAHFKLKGVKGGFFLRDCKSGKGTFVNDEGVEQCRLEFGDKIQVGETLISFLQDPTSGRAQDPLVGKTIDGKYQITSHLGRGGMGMVYRATQLGLDREIALKILSPQLVKDQALVDLFQREAQAAAALNHPNITQVYDVGRSDDLYYYSMEFFPGGSLEARLEREGKLDVDVAVGIILDAARGLEYAERKGIVHRDIKPDNLMVDGEGTAKIADLGLATRGEPTQKGARVFGTPHFISPEQALGKDVDHRSDIYSLGATFYRLLTGHTPFQGSDIKEILRKQVKEPAPPLRIEHPEVPENIERIVLKMMQKDPEDRYASASELIADLEASSVVGSGSMMKVAAFAAVLLIAGGAAFFMFGNKGDDKDPAESKTASAKDDRKRPEPPEPDPELQKQLRESRAKAAFLELRENATADDYDSISEQYPETEYGKLAISKAAEIRAAVKAAAEEAKREREHLVELMGTLEGDLTPLLEANRFADAHHTLETFVGIEELAASEEHGARIDELRKTITQNATQHYQDTIEQSRRLEIDHDFDGARALMTDLVERYRAKGEPGHDELQAIVAEGKTYLKELDKAERSWFAVLYEKDHATFIKAINQDEIVQAFRKLRPDTAADVLAPTIQALETDAYRQRVESLVNRWRTENAAMESFQNAVRSGKLLRQDLQTDLVEGEIEGLAGEMLIVRRRNRPEQTSLTEFDTIHRIVSLLVDRWEVPAAQKVSVASFFADLSLMHMTRRVDSANEKLYDAALAIAQASGDAATQQRITREVEAAKLYIQSYFAFENQKFQLAIDNIKQLSRDYRSSDVFAFFSDGTSPLYGPAARDDDAEDAEGQSEENGEPADVETNQGEDGEPADQDKRANDPPGPSPKGEDRSDNRSGESGRRGGQESGNRSRRNG
ncbi:MAG: FHA domain-containing serine/threonine-protein kinase [Planctomycetota bacterium]